MKSAKRLPRDDISVQILLLARSGITKEKIAEIVALPLHQLQRDMATLVDRGLLRFDVKKGVWLTTDKGHAYLEGVQTPHDPDRA